MKKLNIVFLIGVFLIAVSCDLKVPGKSDIPSWSLNLEFPILKETVNVDDLLGDSLIVKLPYNGDSIYAYTDTFDVEEVKVGDQLNIDDIEKSFSQGVEDVKTDETEEHYSSGLDTVGVDPVSKSVVSEIGKITLNDTEPVETAPVTLVDIFPELPENGNSYTIPQNTEMPTIYRDISFSDIDSASFSNGYLEVKIVNHLVIELGIPVNIELLNGDSSSIGVTASWDGVISPDDSSTTIVDLAGKTLPGNIIVEISGEVCENGNATGTVNDEVRNSYFVVKTQITDLRVTSAKAVIPEQSIDTTGTIELAESENKVKEAVIMNGTLAIDIDNRLPVDGNIHLTINSLKDASSQAFTKDIPIKAEQRSNSLGDISGWSLVMDDISEQKVDYSYEVLTVDSDDKVPITEDDSVRVHISLYGKGSEDQITFSKFEGIVSQEPIVESGEVDVTTDSRITSAEISEGSISITITNNINQSLGALPILDITIPEILDSEKNPLTISQVEIGPGKNVLNVNNANGSLENYTIEPNTIEIDSDSFTQNITYNYKVSIPSDEVGSYSLLDSILVDIQLSELSFSSVTGYFSQEAIVKMDSISIEETTKIEEAVISNGELVLEIVNNIGAVADVSFSVTEIVDKVTGKPFKHYIELPASIDPIIEKIPLVPYKIELPSAVQGKEQKIHYKSTISIPSDEEMTLFLDQDFDVDVKLTDMSFSRVSGYIDTVEVDIDTVEEEIDALPEELEGVNLSNVDIILSFDTNIGVPVKLDLSISSYSDDGESVTKEVSQIITENPIVEIPDPEDLINIKPDRIVATGKAMVYGEGEVDTSQYVKGSIYVTVPFEIELGEDASVELDPELVEADLPEEVNFERVTLYADIDNLFEFGGILEVIAAEDTLYFIEPSGVAPDTLAIFNLLPGPDVSFLDSIVLDEEDFDLFEDSVYVKGIVSLLGRSDGEPSRLLSTDSLTVLLYGKIRGSFDINEED